MTVSVPEPEPVQPFVSVTVTLYGPAVLALIVEVVAPLLQAYVTAPVPPVGVAVSVAGSVLEHTAGLLTDTVGFGFTVNVAPVELAVPHAFVKTARYLFPL